jgi:NACHT domain
MRPEPESGSTPADGSSILVTARELGERLAQELTVTDWRAVVAVVVAAPGLQQDAEDACTKAVEAAGIAQSETIQWVVRRDEAGVEQLRGINQARDTFLRDKRLICLRAASAADVRFLRKTAPDLTSAIDLFVELRSAVESAPEWSTCREQLRALMEERHGTLDFTGLLPASVEQRKLPLPELYQPLVEPYPIEHEISIHRGGLLVLGHPGTGKTTYVRHLAWTYARGLGDPLGIGAKVPLLISLSDYGYEREHDRVSSLVDFLPRWLAEQGVEQAESVTEHLSEVLLLLDGLDEIRAAGARGAVLTEVSRLLDAGRVTGVVVTGRSFLVDELSEDITLRRVSTREPNDQEIQSFLGKFVELRRGSAANADDLVRRVKQDADLRALAGTPLMLAFMAILDELEGHLPDRRIEIYYRLGEMLVDRWTHARSIGTSSHRRERPTRAGALRVLGPLAWWTVEQGGGAVPEEALSQEIERIEARRTGPEDATRQATALLDLLRTDTALLVPRAGRRWSFVHSSIGEYFAGIEVERDRRRWHELLDDPFRPEWREIVLFCAGQLGVIEGRTESLDALVSAVLTKSRRKGRYDAKYPSLLIGLLKESPGLSRRQIDQLVERLLELVLMMAYSPSAAYQMQDEFTSLLFSAHGSVADSLRACLQQWFSHFADQIAWERLMNSAQDGALQIVELARMHVDRAAWFVAFGYALGPFVTGLSCGWFRRYGIDLAPTLSLWRQETHWRYRFAEWLMAGDENVWRRPFAEVVRELQIE